MEVTSLVSYVLSFLTIVGDIVIVVLLVLLLQYRKERKEIAILSLFRKKALLFAFIVSLIATLGSLFYSEIMEFEPCKLCWFQRIFMYPLVFLFGVALWKKERAIGDYAITLSLIGAVISTYHYLLQVGFLSSLPCSAVGYSVSCSQRFVMNFGYITIPMMALTAFLLGALSMTVQNVYKR